MKQPLNLNELGRMLQYVNSDAPRDDWVIVLMAIKSEFGDDAREVAQSWSQTAGSYKDADFKATWKSIKARGGVTIASLVKQAQQAGFKFSDVGACDVERLKAERRERQIKLNEQKAIEQKQVEQTYINASNQAIKIVESAGYAQNTHPYLVSKGIKPHGIKSGRYMGQDDWLIIPVYGTEQPFTGFIQSIQYINHAGDKRFLKGGKKSGGFYPIQWIENAPMVLCEGFATGATLAEHYTQNCTVLCCFDAGNLEKVTAWAVSAYEGLEIIIAGDNDHLSQTNTGADTTKRLENKYGVKSFIPVFHSHEIGSDWNDRYRFDLLEGVA